MEKLELPSEEDKVVDRHLDEALTMKPRFFEVDSANESAMNRMLLGDYHEGIRPNRDARLRCLDGFSTFQVYSAALSIRAADELLAKLPKENVDPGLRTAVTASKRAFVHGSPRQREEALENLESLAMKAYEAYWSRSQEMEAELRTLIADYEAFGTRTQEARRYLDVAASAKQFAKGFKRLSDDFKRILIDGRDYTSGAWFDYCQFDAAGPDSVPAILRKRLTAANDQIGPEPVIHGDWRFQTRVQILQSLLRGEQDGISICETGVIVWMDRILRAYPPDIPIRNVDKPYFTAQPV